ncbi:hypothetical protein MMC08_007319 [Hypocenomyce scalaris]|nr:hypothetical protein [Hypocenomyce scalaris]
MTTLSTASSVIGFISFGFTLLIWTNIFWTAFTTLWAAPEEISLYLANLKQELYEERECLKKSRRRQKSGVGWGGKISRTHVDPQPEKVLNDTVKSLIREFKRLERPFLEDYAVDRDMDLDRADASLRSDYKDMDLGRRIIWLRSKSDVVRLAQRVERVQMRRIARETTDALL